MTRCQVNASFVAATDQGIPLSCVIDQKPSHRDGCHRQKVLSVLPLTSLLRCQPHPRLVDDDRWLQCDLMVFVRKVRPGDSPQIIHEGGGNAVECRCLLSPFGIEQGGDIGFVRMVRV